jgi:hypothetical protein
MATMLSSAKSIRGAAVTASAPRRAARTTAARLQVSAHCQVPCGIFDDARQIAKIKEDAATIRKAQAELTDAGAPANVGAANTFTRWVIYKEKHADAIIDDMGYYHMAQRFPKFEFASEQDKLEALGLHHAVMVAAMKAKQSSEVATSDALDAAIDAVAALPMYNQ